MQFVRRQQEVPIGGVRVIFPFKPYPSQKAMMAKVIQALNHSWNALLESPTGSGKSLALLCSALAWQERQRDRNGPAAVVCDCACHSKTAPSAEHAPIPCQHGIKTEVGSHPQCQNGTETRSSPGAVEKGREDAGGVAAGEVSVCGGDSGDVTEMDKDFRQPKKRYRTPGGVASGSKRVRVKGVVYEKDEGGGEGEGGGEPWKMEVKTEPMSASQQPAVMDTGIPSTAHTSTSLNPPSDSTSSCSVCQCATQASGGAPKIYFATRTHQQISQITHELAKTAYTATPMCILGSRQHACIHPDVVTSRRKNDECKRLLDEGACSFYYRVAKKLGSQAQLLQHGLSTAWDMEDFVSLGKRVKACPYFALRGIKEEAHIIFCPYNYLIDPLIRDQMLIDLQGQVVVLDEAHNMEDSAREAASVTVISSQLEEVADQLRDILITYFGKLRHKFEYLLGICVSISNWIADTIAAQPHYGFDQTCGIWPGQDFVPELKKMGIIDQTPSLIKQHVKAIMDAANEQRQRDDDEPAETVPALPTLAASLLKGLAMVLSYLLRQYTDDYRISLMRTATTKLKDDGWKRRRRNRVAESVWVYSLNFWCLNPAVSFSQLSCARSVVLTSGTLSPLSSFSSELGMVFNVQLEASHVVPESQTLIRSLSCGPHGRILCANYQNSETYEFQDEVGAVVDHVCQTVPNGVLCFFSSYNMLNKLTGRWKVTGMWTNIEQKKTIVVEPHGSNKAEFEAAMKLFYTTVEASSSGSHMTGHMTGALFLAVCRGKVSEGLDFSDDNARAVITIGIPFPSIKDKQVELKREYNNQHCRSRDLLTGSEWYEIQAFRAINQALGRCIRHRKDWGALILVDDRFGKGYRYTRGLSKWIRQRVCHERKFSSLIAALTAFSEKMAAVAADTDTSVLEVTSCAAETSTLLYSGCQTPLPPSPSPSSHPHPLTPHTHCTPSPTGRPSALGDLISHLRSFRYPDRTQPQPSSSLTNGPPTNEAIGEPLTNEGIREPLTNESIREPLTNEAISSAVPLGETAGVVLNDSVEITSVDTANNDVIMVEASPPHPPSPHPTLPSLPTTSPLLFPSTDVTSTHTSPHSPLTLPAALTEQSSGHTLTTRYGGDKTSPLTNCNHLAEGERDRERKGGREGESMLAIEAVIKKAATPLRKTKRVNTRMGVRRKRECVEDSTDCSGITATAAEVVRATVVCGGCGENISQSGVMVKKLELREALLGKVKVHHIEMSRLSSHLRPDSPVYLFPAVGVVCGVREEALCNAVWDVKLGLCYDLLQCARGHVVGVRVHAAQGPNDAMLNLINKVILSVDKTELVEE